MDCLFILYRKVVMEVDHFLMFVIGIATGFVIKTLLYWLKVQEAAKASEGDKFTEVVEFTFGDFDFRFEAQIVNGYFHYKTRKPGRPEGKIPYQNLAQLSLDIQRIFKNHDNEIRWEVIESEIVEGKLEVLAFRFELDGESFEYYPEPRNCWMVGIYNPALPKENRAIFDPNINKLDRSKNRLYSNPQKMAKDTIKNLREWRRLVPYEMAAGRMKRLY